MKKFLALVMMLFLFFSCSIKVGREKNMSYYTPEHIYLTPESEKAVRLSTQLSMVVIPYFDNLVKLSLGSTDSSGKKIPNSTAENAWLGLWNIEKGKITIAYPPAIEGAPKTISAEKGFTAFISQSRGAFKEMRFINTTVYKATDASIYFVRCDGEMVADTPKPIPYKNHYLFIVHVENNKIVEVEEHFDPIKFGEFLKRMFSQLSQTEK